MNSSSIKTVLRNARKVLTSKGWVKGDDHKVEDGQSKFCARGAVYIAAGARVNVTTKLDPYSGDVVTYGQWDTSDLDLEANNATMRLLHQVAERVAKERDIDPYGEVCSVVGLNDLPGSTLDDVLATFDEAIAIVEAQELLAKHGELASV